ncbi:chemotaxis protein CheW [Pararoseomonas indoligenes]|uniref:Chemotaxis protein CheW n=1 Tax=Roseomonas indoligenes TaxID=2820811 RepID=A0A940MZ45_9PROT|nr:chemotaxis protein CheW [Pararoseomonas indoligenes]MBP0491332.1 chemotaxis protein CheW [Pararoseomonas indoligenes]
MAALPEPPLPGSPAGKGALVLFSAGGALLALPREAVRALLPLPNLDSPPGLPAPLAGFLNLGGSAVPVVALTVLLGLPAGPLHPYRHLILLETAVTGPAGPVALLVDRAADVLPAGLPLRPTEEDTSLGGVVAGAVELPAASGGGTAHLLAPDRLLMAEEAAILGALTGQAQARLARWTATAEES